ncbi:IS630 family transposase [Geitlerinema sp. P-1104]|jgi:putative transposase|uniref:IS630 family transposase n=1 Tax=Geitlerinema sp. P-1104 TaxID=2546230 RepID=UPI001476B1CB|nr:IS630 family transposase [Geitlerinema sp. P-1104]NMG58854.1 IS630 family transposase [Geitlerinema sp. P-1104]
MTIIDELDDFIKNTQNAQEVKRALAVKMILTGTSYHEIENLLQVSHSFISKWKNQALFHGVDSLKLQYKGSKSYLKPSSRAVVIEWLREQDYLRLGDLKRYLEQEHKVVYASDQSYYALFKEAGISWKKTQKKNPAKDEKKVQAKKEEIERKLKKWEAEIMAGKLAVFMIDECHLLWGDLLGHAWGRTDTRLEVPIQNQKNRQTYYGALDYQNHEFIVKDYLAGNTENTINFIKYLRKQRPGQRLAIFWDGASYHNSEEFQEYLKQVNGELPEDKWLVHCTNFAPNAPEQNPVEDIWLQTKNFIRQFYHLCTSFKMVKGLFKFFADGQIFDFPKLSHYAVLPQLS